MTRIYCVFGNFSTNMDVHSHFARSGAEVMLLAQYFIKYDSTIRDDRCYYEYQLFVRGSSESEPIIARIEEWGSRRIAYENIRANIGDPFGPSKNVDLGPVVFYYFGDREPIQRIREKLEQALPGVEFEGWESFLKAISERT